MDESIKKSIYDFFSLKDKVAVITGAGNGIGKATAKMMAELGAAVIACDIEKEPLKQTMLEIIEAGGSVEALTCDITQPVQVKSVIEQVQDMHGTIHILVNNGATMGGGKTVEKVDESEFDRLIDVNLRGVYRFIYEVLPIMRKQQYGKIVNVSSVAAIAGDMTDIHYSAAKGGVISMSKTLAKELAQEKINVNVVAPGLIKTRMMHEWEIEPALKRFHRIGEPEDVAATICFLASDAASYFSGQVLSPNGGEYMV